MKLRKLAITLAAATVMAAGSMIAFAAWTATGSGTGATKALTAQAVTVTAVTPATGCLFPGNATACPVQFTITNPNPYKIKFDKLTAGAVTSSDTTVCPSANVSAITTEQTGLDFTVDASTTSATFTSPNLLSMVFGAPDGCQAKSFTAVLSLTGIQVV